MIIDCPICGVSCLSRRDDGGKLYHICSHCRFTFLDPSLRPGPDAEKKRYELHNNDPGDEGYRNWLASFADKAVLPYVGPRCRVLDFGCGPEPVLADILREKGYIVDIYDLFFHHIPFGDNYDMITSTEVLEHVAEPLSLLDELKTKLKPGGFLAIKTMFRPDGDDDFFRWWYRQDITHISFFTVQSMEILSERSGLTIEWCDGKSITLFRN